MACDGGSLGLFDDIAVLGAVEAGAVLAMLGGRFAPACAWLRAVLARVRSLAASTAPARGERRVGAAGKWLAREGEKIMLRIYPVIIEMLTELRPLIARIQRHDSDLTRQLRRCCASVALNTGEGMFSRGKNRSVRYHTALGSPREVLSCLEVAQALGYIAALDDALVARLNRIIGTLVRLVGT